jgi:hypothetical protein
LQAGMCNNNGTHGRQQKSRASGISLTPDASCGRASPDGVQLYKTRVLYHSRADFRPELMASSQGHVASQNGHCSAYYVDQK